MNFVKTLRGKFAAFAAGIALAAVGVALANTGYIGNDPSTGLNGIPGAQMSIGTPPVVSVTGSSCVISTAAAGGPSAGTFIQTGGTACTFTLTFPAASPAGWFCAVVDLTTPADTVKAASTTTKTWVSGSSTVVTADVFQYECTGY